MYRPDKLILTSEGNDLLIELISDCLSNPIICSTPTPRLSHPSSRKVFHDPAATKSSQSLLVLDLSKVWHINPCPILYNQNLCFLMNGLPCLLHRCRIPTQHFPLLNLPQQVSTNPLFGITFLMLGLPFPLH